MEVNKKEVAGEWVMGTADIQQMNSDETCLGIEFGSTRIKAVLIDKAHNQIASGSYTWENRLENGLWTYTLDDIWEGIRNCYAQLAEDVRQKYCIQLETVGAIGISAMMHGYMVFDKKDRLLVPFRTWRNTNTGKAAQKLTELFGFNVPQRWSVAHLYNSILNGEEHVPEIRFLTTLAGYIHWQLTGERVIGVGDASGMFPINEMRKYDSCMLQRFEELVADRGFAWKLEGILPKGLLAGADAGRLTEEGARLLDPLGVLKAGIPMCPPEGDAGTGMVATNSVRQRTGNVSAGTSVFVMAVLEKPLLKVFPEIDVVTTPSGDPVAMVHCNNFLSDIDTWIKLIGDAAVALGAEVDKNKLYCTLFNSALEGSADCGGLLTYNYISGEPVSQLAKGCPLFMRAPDAKLDLPNFMRAHLYSACATLKIGMDILFGENVKLDTIMGHGGFFKVPEVGQRIMSVALGVPVSVMTTAGEGGPWGMAVLSSYMKNNRGEALADYLTAHVFTKAEYRTVAPVPEDESGFMSFMDRYKAGLAVEKMAAEIFCD